MGCYETINVPCPKCGEKYPAQSKSGPCMMGWYELDSAPEDVILDVNRHAPFRCDKCNTVFEVALLPSHEVCPTCRQHLPSRRTVIDLGPDARSKYEQESEDFKDRLMGLISL